QLAGDRGRALADKARASWGSKLTLDDFAQMERTGKMPTFKIDPKTGNPVAMYYPQGYKAAQEMLDEWNKVGQWAAKYGIIPNEINFLKPGSKAKMYFPHALEDAYGTAIELGENAKKAGRESRDPFGYYTKERIHETLADGMAAGVKYEPDMIRV